MHVRKSVHFLLKKTARRTCANKNLSYASCKPTQFDKLQLIFRSLPLTFFVQVFVLCDFAVKTEKDTVAVVVAKQRKGIAKISAPKTCEYYRRKLADKSEIFQKQPHKQHKTVGWNSKRKKTTKE